MLKLQATIYYYAQLSTSRIGGQTFQSGPLFHLSTCSHISINNTNSANRYICNSWRMADNSHIKIIPKTSPSTNLTEVSINSPPFPGRSPPPRLDG